MTEISIEVHDAAVQALLNRLQARVKNMRPAFTEIGGDLTTRIQLGFEGSHDPWGAVWRRLKRPRPRNKAKGDSGKPLLDTNVLSNSIHPHADATSLTIGTKEPYAAIHQFGGTIKRKARSQDVYFRQNQRTGEVGNRFVKKRRSNFAQTVDVGAHSIVIPPRPFLPIRGNQAELPPSWQAAVVGILQRRLAEAAQ